MNAELGLEEGVQRIEFSFDSHDGASRIHAMLWLPQGDCARAPKGIVQIVHGMAEHIARYDDFARFLAARGFAVCGSSHIGHGRSARSLDDLGVLPEDGARIMVADVHRLRCQVTGEFPDGVPYVVFGHSMGSFVLRAYLVRFGKGLAAAIVCGTGQQPVLASRAGGAISRIIGRRRGFGYRSKLVDSLVLGSYSRAIRHARTDLDWLNTDPARVDDYIADPYCGCMFSVGGFASLTDLTAMAASRACVRAVPAKLPVLFISGSCDPVGGMGKGVKAAAAAMARHSTAAVELRLYDGMRHEILNEPGHARVYADVLAFIEESCSQEGPR